MRNMPSLKSRKFYLKIFMMQRKIKELLNVIMLNVSFRIYIIFNWDIYIVFNEDIMIQNDYIHQERYQQTS